MAYKTTSEHLRDLLQDTFGVSFFKAFFDSDPGVIGQSYLPAIVVDASDAVYSLDGAPTGFDTVTQTITIKLLLNKRDDFGADPTQNLTKKKLELLIHGRDDAGHLLSNSVLGVLRSKFTSVYDNISTHQEQISFPTVDRSLDEEMITAEGHIIITITSRQPIQNRT